MNKNNNEKFLFNNGGTQVFPNFTTQDCAVVDISLDCHGKIGVKGVVIDNSQKSTEELQEIEIQWRNAQLSSTDEFGLNDYPDNELRASMRNYRQELRDYPSIEGFGDSSLRPIDPRN